VSNRKLHAITIALLISGCTTIDYVPPTSGTPTAEATFRSLVRAGGLLIRMTDSGACVRGAHWVTMAEFDPLIRKYGDQGPVAIEAGNRLIFEASWDNAAGPYQRVSCTSVGSFVPKAGHHYTITQDRRFVGGRMACRLSVVEQETGLDPQQRSVDWDPLGVLQVTGCK
jgi:hypothetical protein